MTWVRHLPTVILGALALWAPALVQLLAGNLDVSVAALRLTAAMALLALGVEVVARLVDAYRNTPHGTPRRRRDDRIVDGEVAAARARPE